MKKIAVMLPEAYRGGTLRAAKNIAKSLAMGSQKKNDPVQVVFSYRRWANYDLYADFKDLTDMGILLRETEWQLVKHSEIATLSSWMDIDENKSANADWCIPCDGANNFFDCDLWVIISDRLPAPLYPIKKYICVIYDYLQRYAPGIFSTKNDWRRQEDVYFPLVRNAERVLVTTPSTRADMISYAGISPSRVSLIEMDFELLDDTVCLESEDLNLPQNYFLWTTNTDSHKNQMNALNALEYYFEELGGRLHVIMTGVYTEYFDPENHFDASDGLLNDLLMKLPQVKFLRKKLAENQYLRKKIKIMGCVSDIRYASILKNAQFLWHPNLNDNGTFSVIEAAWFNHPSLAAHYPAMKYIDQTFNLNLTFFDPHNVLNMGNSLFWMEKNYKSIMLPPREALSQRSWKAHADSLYQIVSQILQG